MNFRPALRTIALAAALLAAPVTRAADLFPFVLPWDDASPSITNISSWLDKPAGKDGFISSHDGHLFAGKKRVRFFGVNLVLGGNFPNHTDADQVAPRMAKFGINCVRFHQMDVNTAPTGLLKKDKKTFDEDSLDRLDYFIAQLKKNGIYADLTLHVGLDYPGFKRWDGAPGYFKGVDNFFQPFIDEQHEYARALLTHVNAYTHKAYTDETAIAFIEINNESGLINEWNNGTLDALPDPFAEALQKQWNDWLKKKYDPAAKLAGAWGKGEPLGQEMLKPAQNAWRLEQHGEAKAELNFEAGEGTGGETMHVHVTQPGRDSSHAQVWQAGLTLAKDKTYTIHFRAKSDAPRRINIVLNQAHEPWRGLASQGIQLTTDWQDFTVALPPAQAADDKARLALANLGGAAGDFWFEGLSLRPGGVAGLKEGESLGSIPFFRKKDVGFRTIAAQRDWNQFLIDTESNYWTGMRRFVREELKAHSPVVGTATGSSPWLVQAKLDVVDAHNYWQRPTFPHKPGDPQDWDVQNVSMAGAADGGALPGLALRRVAGKPFIVTEYNASAPNTYSSEAFLELCAVAGLQDWDGVFASTYSRREDAWDTQHITSFFDIDQHPTKMATLPAALALFMRGDIEPPPDSPVVAEVNWGDAVESVRKNGPAVDARFYGIPREETFRFPIGLRIAGATKVQVPKATGDSSVLCSENGQLTWDTVAHRMLLASPGSAGVVGSVKEGETIELGGVRIIPGATRQNWATINATIIEGRDFEHAKRILITATGLAENTGMKWKNVQKSSVGADWGHEPSLVEGISAKIGLPYQKGGQAWSLDARGQRQTEIAVKRVTGKAEMEISSAHQTLWWEIAFP
ncbi:MAG: carbohydrate binding domain-containing protein [Chthoniobacter sp.]|nr:carbohydrate binding domain-containing protein [Chthoniobacter sp.]